MKPEDLVFQELLKFGEHCKATLSMAEVRRAAAAYLSRIMGTVRGASGPCPYCYRATDGVHVVMVDRCSHPDREKWINEQPVIESIPLEEAAYTITTHNSPDDKAQVVADKVAQDNFSNSPATVGKGEPNPIDVYEQGEPHCPKCDSDMKEFVTILRCRNLKCRHIYTKRFPPKG